MAGNTGLTRFSLSVLFRELERRAAAKDTLPLDNMSVITKSQKPLKKKVKKNVITTVFIAMH